MSLFNLVVFIWFYLSSKTRIWEMYILFLYFCLSLPTRSDTVGFLLASNVSKIDISISNMHGGGEPLQMVIEIWA